MTATAVSKMNADTDTANAMSMIKRNTDAMLQLIRDLVDFSSSGLGRAMPLNRGLVNLEVLCREVIESFRSMHPGRTLRMHSDGDVNGLWDAGRIRQIISNLVGNAIQHGSPDGPIVLSVLSEVTPPAESGLGGSSVVLSVHNEGSPIPPRLLRTIFEPLKRYATLDSATHRTPGSIGLGLYIVREIVAAKGGTVTVSSTAEEGTTFTVRIPRYLPVEGENGNDAKYANSTSVGSKI
jgi:signal transduction histidine kinase